MGRKKISTTVYLTPEQVEQVAELSRRTKVPQAVYFREGVDLVLSKYSERLSYGTTLVEIFANEEEEGGDDPEM